MFGKLLAAWREEDRCAAQAAANRIWLSVALALVVCLILLLAHSAQ